MKKNILGFGLISLFTLNSFGQKDCNIRDHYGDFIQVRKISYEGKDVFGKKIVETDRQSCFSKLVNNNILLVDYLLTNFSAPPDQEKLKDISDSIALNRVYIADLKEDSAFSRIMTALVDKTVEKRLPKDTASMDDLLGVAVKFFSLRRITKEGYYVGKVCVGANDIEATEGERKPFIEAFCFSSVFRNLKNEEYNMYDEYIEAVKELYKVNLGINKEERLLRAQGALFLLLRNNEELKRILKNEYEKSKDYLPFVLTSK